MAAKDKTNEFYEDIRKEYMKLTSIKEFGVKKYHEDWVRAKLAKMFYREVKTIENIIFYRV